MKRVVKIISVTLILAGLVYFGAAIGRSDLELNTFRELIEDSATGIMISTIGWLGGAFVNA
jgi:hypothetical protein